MYPLSNPKIIGLRDAVMPLLKHAHGLLELRKYEEAREALVRARTEAAKIGVKSTWIDYSLAVVSDYLGDLERALDHIHDALAADPVNVPMFTSYEIIVSRARASLASPERAPDDVSTPRVYGRLLALGAADVPCHLAMGKFLLAINEVDDALALLGAVTVLAPNAPEVWTLKAAAARKAGKPSIAKDAETKAAMFAETNTHGSEVVPNVPVAEA